jgi:hypothetical protein
MIRLCSEQTGYLTLRPNYRLETDREKAPSTQPLRYKEAKP